jgi:hypothetical protein
MNPPFQQKEKGKRGQSELFEEKGKRKKGRKHLLIFFVRFESRMGLTSFVLGAAACWGLLHGAIFFFTKVHLFIFHPEEIEKKRKKKKRLSLHFSPIALSCQTQESSSR